MTGRPRVRRHQVLLGLVDGGVVFLAFAVTFGAFGRFDAIGVVLNSLGAAVIGVGAIWIAGLWVARVIAVRWVELARLTRVAAILFVGALVLDRVPGSPITLLSALVACVASWVLLIVWRSIHRSWMRVSRARGRSRQRVLVVGSDRRTMEVIRTFEVHPEAGMQVVGLVGSERSAQAAGYRSIWLGELSDLDAVLARVPSDCALIGSTDEVDPVTLERLLRIAPDVYAVPVSGGIDVRRVSTTAFANETLLHVERSDLSPFAWGVKWTFDVLVASILLVVTSPLFAVIRHRDQGDRPWSGAVPPAARRSRRAGLRAAQVPHDGRGCGGWAGRAARRQRPFGPAVQARRRSARHARRSVPAGDEPGRAAAADQRGAWRHEPGRAATGAAPGGRRVHGRAAVAPRRPTGHHRAVAGGSARQPGVRRLRPPRPVLRQELVAGPRHRHHAGNGRAAGDAPAARSQDR